MLVASTLLLATAVRAAFTPLWEARFPFVSYYPAVMFVAYVAGWRAAVVATLGGAVLIALLFLPRPLHPEDVGALGFFVCANAFILALAERLTRGRAEAETAAAEARGREEQLRASERQFRSLFETASVGHAQADPVTGRLLRVNRKLCEITGYAEDELRAMTFYDLTHPDDRDENRRSFDRFVRDRAPAFTIEKRYVRKDGRVVRAKVAAALVCDEVGRPMYTGAVIEDVTAARKASEALARSREAIRAILDAAPVAIWIAHDPACRDVTQNHFADALLGASGRDLPCQAPLQRAAASGEAIRDVEFDVVRPDGRRISFLGGAVPLLGADGSVRGSVVACIDITARNEADEALRHQLDLTHTITANTPSMLLMMDRDGRATFANEAASQLTGYAARELIGQVLHEKIHHTRPDGSPYPIADCPLDRALPRRAIVTGHEDVFVRKDGSFFPVRCAARPIFRGNEPIGTVIEAQDVTQEKRALDALRAREHELRLALRSGRMASVVWDIPADTATWSEEYFALIGLPPNAIAPSYGAWRERVHPDDRARVEALVERAMRERRDLVMEYRNLWADGTIKWVEARGHFDYDAAGRPLRMTGILMDIDQRKASEQERERAALAMERIQRITDIVLSDLALDPLLHELLIRIAAILHADTSAILLCGADGEDRDLEVAATVGLEEDAARGLRIPVGRGFAGAVAAERRPLVWDDVDPARLVSPVLRAKGIRCLAGVPLRSGERLLGVLHVGSLRPNAFTPDDVRLLQLAAARIALAIERTARRDAERRARDVAEQANRAKDEFLAMLGHELRNPLAAIRNAVLTAEVRGASSDQALAIVRRQSSRLGRLVDDLLDVTRIAQKKIRLDMKPVDLAAVARHALETTRAFLDERRHDVSVSLADAVRVRGDAERLEQVAGNLLANAAKYTEPGGHIAIAVERDGPDAVLRVRDTGIGIAPEALPSLFDLFAQSDGAIDRTRGGLGVGLSIVRRLVELHGGTIEARSEGVGLGSEFIVRLPALASAGVPEADESPTPVAAPGARVLLVEDDVDVAEALSMLLEAVGADVLVARDGSAALAAARTAMPDVAFVDIGLPGMDGYEVARRIRALPGGHRPTLVALTGYGQAEDRRRALAAGFDEHRTKPVELDALQRLVRPASRRHRHTPPTLQ